MALNPPVDEINQMRLWLHNAPDEVINILVNNATQQIWNRLLLQARGRYLFHEQLRIVGELAKLGVAPNKTVAELAAEVGYTGG